MRKFINKRTFINKNSLFANKTKYDSWSNGDIRLVGGSTDMKAMSRYVTIMPRAQYVMITGE